MFSFNKCFSLRQSYLKFNKFSILANKRGNCADILKTTTTSNSKEIKFSTYHWARKSTASINQNKLSLESDFKRNLTTTACSFTTTKNTENMENKSEKINVNKEELKKRLTPLQYHVTQEAATERPFTGCYNKHYEKGVYQCIVCHQDLFSSDTKYDSGCGWPAFNDVLDKGKVTLHRDASIPDRVRTEVRCSKCSAHMGHVFEDGPKPTRKRYCINSAAIEFLPAEELNKQAAAGTGATQNIVTGGTPIAQQ